MAVHASQTTQNALRQAESSCESQGTRLTEKRRQVLMGLLNSKKALSAYGLADYCRDELGYELPVMSVYRILEFLGKVDLVHRLSLAKKYVACAHIACKHDHERPQFLICTNCSGVQEVSIDAKLIKSLSKSVTDAGFHLTSQQLEFDCLCGDCVD